jgi:hypothetical protein
MGDDGFSAQIADDAASRPGQGSGFPMRKFVILCVGVYELRKNTSKPSCFVWLWYQGPPCSNISRVAQRIRLMKFLANQSLRAGQA